MSNYENITPNRNMYKLAKKSFSKILEDLDPTSGYVDDSSLQSLDAFQRQLKRFDIRVSGPDSDVVDKFFRTSESAALFPEYVARAIKVGMEESNIIPDIVAATTTIDGLDYRSITSLSGDGFEPSPVGEGAQIPETVIKTKENLIKLYKRGRLLVASYEAIRFQRLDIFTVALRQIGAAITASHMKDAVNVIIDGDGNDNPAPQIATATADVLTYDDLVNLWSQFDPYEMNVMLVSNSTMQKILQLNEFKDPSTGLNFQATGKLTTPLGAKLIRSSAVPDDMVIGLDRRYALEFVRTGDIMLDSDKLIDRQLERTAVTSIAGFAKIIPEAACVMNI